MDSKWCEICKRNFVNNNTFRGHLSGKKHSRNVRNEERKKEMKLVVFQEQNLIKADEIKNPIEIQPTIDPIKIALVRGLTFNDQLHILLNFIQNPNDEFVSICDEICEHLNWLLRTVCSPCKVIKFGSIITGLHLKGSDLDMFLNTGDDDKVIALIFDRVAQILYDHKLFFTQVRPFPKARTPIIRFKYIPTNTDCDLSFHSNGLYNSRIIKDLLSLDSRVKPLIIIIKYWAKQLNISGTGKITSYPLVMAIIFFLQQLQILPAINYIQSKSKLPDYLRKRQVNMNSEIRSKYACKCNIPELTYLFFIFYAQFNFYNSIICPADGSLYRKHEYPNIAKELGINAELLDINDLACIQDPIRLDQNIASEWTAQLVIDFQNYCTIASDICAKEANDNYNGLLATLYDAVTNQQLKKFENFVYEPNYGARKKFDEIIQINSKYRQENRTMEEGIKRSWKDYLLEKRWEEQIQREEFMEQMRRSHEQERVKHERKEFIICFMILVILVVCSLVFVRILIIFSPEKKVETNHSNWYTRIRNWFFSVE